jgi:hypothetical protein
MRRNLGALLLGALAGGMIIHLNHAHRLEQLYWDKERLKVQLFETTERLSRIEEMWADQQKGEISSVDFVIKGETNPFVELELQRLVGEITSGLVGAAIREVQPDLLVALLHRRKFTVEKKDYLVTVNWVVIAPETLFNLSVSPAPGGD